MSDPSTESFFWGTATASYQIEGAVSFGVELTIGTLWLLPTIQ